MSMDSVHEPSKWVCRLESSFGESTPGYGTGFLINISGSKKLCIMTAAHNILNVNAGWIVEIIVTFSNGLTLKATRKECFVSNIYENNPTDDSSQESSIGDFGLIALDRKRFGSTSEQFPGACAFSVWLSDYELLQSQVFVHGYMEGKEAQTRSTSPLLRVTKNSLHYGIDTAGGVSGAPVFTVDANGGYVAVGIHNYHFRATRLSCRMMFEILSWVHDYSLLRYMEFNSGVSKNSARSTMYLQATSGSRPNAVARPLKAPLNFVLADVPTLPEGDQTSTGKPHYAIMPASAHPGQESKLWMLSFTESGKEVSFEDPVAPRRKHVIGVKQKEIGKIKGKCMEYLGLPDSELSLKVLPSTRTKCECGCITQDHEVTLQRGKGTLFTIS